MLLQQEELPNVSLVLYLEGFPKTEEEENTAGWSEGALCFVFLRSFGG